MIIAKLVVDGVSIRAESCERIPKGIIGAQLAVEFADAAWEGLQKTMVFRGSETKTVLNAEKLVTIPAEVVSTAGVDLMVGVCGTDPEGTVMIPTLWAELGKVWGAALPTEDVTTDPSLPVWAQIQAMVGDLNQLATEDRESLVKAVNELSRRESVDGKDGYTPVRGVDYWTEADKHEIRTYVETAILGGEW